MFALGESRRKRSLKPTIYFVPELAEIVECVIVSVSVVRVCAFVLYPCVCSECMKMYASFDLGMRAVIGAKMAN